MAGQQPVSSGEGVEQAIAVLGSLVRILGIVSAILESVLTAVVARPDLLAAILRPVGATVAEIGKALGNTVPEVGKAVGQAVGGVVSGVGQTAGQAVGAVSELGRPLGQAVEGLGKALGATGTQEQRAETGKSQEEIVNELMSKSTEELQVIFRALEARRKTA